MSARPEVILGNRKRKDGRENVKRITCDLSAAKTEGRVDTLPQNVEKTKEHRHIRFWAPLNNARSSLRLKSISMRLAPASGCIIISEVRLM